MLRAQCRVANCCKVPITLWNIKSDNLSNQSTFVSIVIRFPDIGGETLEKIIKYLHYKDKYSNSTTRIPEFQIDPDEVRGVLLCKISAYNISFQNLKVLICWYLQPMLLNGY